MRSSLLGLYFLAACAAASACGGKTGGLPSDAGMHEATTVLADGMPSATDSPIDNSSPSDSAASAQGDGTAPAAACDPRACSSGCCDTMGCLPGTAGDACGFGGQACTDCAAIGLQCIGSLSDGGGGVCGSFDAGSIQDGAPACGPATCVGCCAGDLCVAGTASSSCGSHGLACQPCTGANVSCVAQGGGGACVGSAMSCGPSNCAGCCDTNGVCQAPSDIGACGAAGTACQFCLAGQACNSGQCVTASGCGPSNCPGCCRGDTCLSGSVDSTACGSGGTACQACSGGAPCFALGPKNGGRCDVGANTDCGTGCLGPGFICHPGTTDDYCTGDPNISDGCGTCGGSCATGICTGGKFCNTLTCGEGCCMPDGTCWTGGVDNAHCGGDNAFSSGQLCIDCGPGYVCDHSKDTLWPTCLIACSPQNCQGCCAGGLCATGTDPTSCGAGGNACAQCASGQSCLNGVCLAVAQCGAIECAGCCQDDVCFVGSDDMTCGMSGAACENCADAGLTCRGATCSP